MLKPTRTSRFFVSLCLSFCAAALTATLPDTARAGVPAAPPAPEQVRELIVAYRGNPAHSGPVAQAASAYGRVVSAQPHLGTYRMELRADVSPYAVAERLRSRGDVLYVEPNYKVRAFAVPNDPYFASEQTAPQRVQAPAAWDLVSPARQVVVAIVDTGVDGTHPDLRDVMLRDSAGSILGHNAITGGSNAKDDEGHGTHCAGIAAATTNNAVGIAGVAGWSPKGGRNQFVRIMPVKVLDETGEGTVADVARGVIWAADMGANVISLSLGSPSRSITLDNAIDYAWSRGCVIVGAAGNESTSAYSYPGASPNVLAVAATDNSDRLTNFSNYGSWVHVAAPGKSILSTLPNSGYGYASGTSMAAPLVAGQLALLMAQKADLTNAQAVAAVVQNTDPYTPYSGRTLSPTAGRVNVLRALQSLTSAPAPVTLSSVTLNPSTLIGGTPSTGTVTLSAAAPSGGVTVSLNSGNRDYVAVPAQVVVPHGATTAGFTANTARVSAQLATAVSATLGTSTVSSTLTLQPQPAAPAQGLREVRVDTSYTRRGAPRYGLFVTLSSPAPKGGVTVTLTSSNSRLLRVPARLRYPQGTNEARVRLSVRNARKVADVTVTARLGESEESTVVSLGRSSRRGR
ncbi:MAG: S8 family peptidase [Armatimonadota bacterium]